MEMRKVYPDGRSVKGLYLSVDLPGVPEDKLELFHNFKNIYFEASVPKIWDIPSPVKIYSGYIILDKDPGENNFEYVVQHGCLHFFFPHCSNGWIYFTHGLESTRLGQSLTTTPILSRIEEVKEFSKNLLDKFTVLEASNTSIKQDLQSFKQNDRLSVFKLPMKYLQYEIEDKVVGDGAFGTVYKGVDTLSNQEVAMKSIPLHANNIDNILAREINIMYDLGNHDHIVKLKNVYPYPLGTTVNLVMEYMGNDLFRTIDECKKGETQVKVERIMQQILLGVSHLHNNGVIHRDIKPENILIDAACQKVKVADFGLSRILGDNLTPQVTALQFRAPEVLLGAKKYTKAIDMWSVGCVFAELVDQVSPFPLKSRAGNGINDMLIAIFKQLGTPTATSWPGVHQMPNFPAHIPTYPQATFKTTRLDNRGNDLLSRMLCVNPEQRITAPEALAHPYFAPVV